MPVLVQPSEGRLSDIYRRRARRLRCRWADHPGKRQQALAELAREVDAIEPAPMLPDHVLRRPELARGFAVEVSEAMNEGPLRYSVRCKLLRRAQAIGIERFEANLIIAAVGHRMGRLDEARPRPQSSLKAVWIALVIELALLLFAAMIWL